MRRSRFSVEQIVGALGAAQAGRKVGEVCRELGITEMTFYRWKAKYGGLDMGGARRLQALDEERRRLEHIKDEQLEDLLALKASLAKKI